MLPDHAPMKLFALITACVFAGLIGLGAAPKKAPAAAAKTDKAVKEASAEVTNAVPVIPESVFVVPKTSQEGRNPFFPNSRTGLEAPKQKEALNIVAFVLNGITSPPRRTAMINGRTFEAGETGEVKLASGKKAKITCEEIRDNSAVILFNGERRELRLRPGL